MNLAEARMCLDILVARLPRFRRETPEMKRFREVCEMRDLGIAMYRQRMRNENPEASKKAVDAMVQAWLLEPPRKSFLSPPPGKPAGRPDLESH